MRCSRWCGGRTRTATSRARTSTPWCRCSPRDSRRGGAREARPWRAGEIPGGPEPAARQMVEYLEASQKILGVIPTQETLVLERFFDEAGGMQLVLHAPFGSRVNRAWGLALRKRFCRSFNFELQAAATEDAIVLSLGPQHSFPLEDVFQYLKPETAEHLLVQAMLDAPLEERRTQAVITRRGLDVKTAEELGKLDQAAIDRVREEAWPDVSSSDELHDALLVSGALTSAECGVRNAEWKGYFEELVKAERAGVLQAGPGLWVAAERLPMLEAVFRGVRCEPALSVPERDRAQAWTREEAVRELVRGRLEVVGPTTAEGVATALGVPVGDVDFALGALEHEGFVLRGRFSPGVADLEWCERRLLARVHR